MSNPAINESIILLHGMGRTRFSMSSLEKYLTNHGYHVINESYPSTQKLIEEISSTHVAKAVERCQQKNTTKIHIVTHSLGGIVTRQYLQNASLPDGSRIVMLSPPNQGSSLVDKIRNIPFYKWFTGKAGQQLTSDANSLVHKLKPIHQEVGIITGNRSLDPWFSWLIKGEDDGKVSVEEARLEEMKDFLVVPHGHTFIMNSKTVQQQVLHFLQYGCFIQ
jgi:hypothetical protein